MKTRITAILASALLITVACGDNAPTGPSPVPTPEPMTPPTTTPPGGTNAVPQVAGTYRGTGIHQHVPPGGGGLGPGPIGNDACTDVEQDGTSVTIEIPVAPWKLRGTITREGTVENVEILHDNRELHATEMAVSGKSLTLHMDWSVTGSAHRHLLDLDVERQPAGAEKCDRTGQTARPGN